MRTHLKFMLGAMLTIAFAVPAILPINVSAQATVICANCSTSITQTSQLAKDIQLVEQAMQQVQLGKQQLQNLTGILKQIQDAPGRLSGLSQDQLASIKQAIATVKNQNIITNDLAKLDSEISGLFKTHFPGYTPGQNYSAAYTAWSENTSNAQLKALDVAHTAEGNSAQVNDALSLIANEAGQSEASGQTSKQLGEIIHVMMILSGQINTLGQLQIAQMNSENKYYQMQIQVARAANKAADRTANKAADAHVDVVSNPFAALQKWTGTLPSPSPQPR